MVERLLEARVSYVKSPSIKRILEKETGFDRTKRSTAVNSAISLYKHSQGIETLEEYLVRIHEANINNLNLPQRLIIQFDLKNGTNKYVREHSLGNIDITKLNQYVELYRETAVYFKKNFIVPGGKGWFD